MSEIDYAARVARGIALMDSEWPSWAQDIDLDRLDVSDGSCCVTAQYYLSTLDPEDRDPYDGANWGYGRRKLNLTDEEYVAHGFNGEALDYVVPDSAYDTLNALWRAEIERRRAQAQGVPAGPETAS